MFDSTYEITKVSKQSAFSNDYRKEITIYRFDTRGKERYLIYVTEYPECFYTIDFCRNKSKKSDNKWTEITGQDDAILILSTVVRLMIKLLYEGYEDSSSFGFVGARMADETNAEVSKRFRIYRKIMLNLIDRNAYVHLEDPKVDAYLILNPKADHNKIVEVARKAFEKEEE